MGWGGFRKIGKGGKGGKGGFRKGGFGGPGQVHFIQIHHNTQFMMVL